MDVETRKSESATAKSPPATPEAPSEGANGAVKVEDAAAAVSETPDWRPLVEQVDPEELRRHPRVAGIVGQMVDAAMRQWHATQQEETSHRATETARLELLKLAREDPDAFAQRYLTDVQKEDVIGQLTRIRQEEAATMARRVGQAFAKIPGWEKLTVDHHAELAAAIRGLSDDEVVAAYNSKALELLMRVGVDGEANTRLAKWKEAELDKERKAIRDEEAAKILKKAAAPDMARSVRQPAIPDFSRMTDDEYNKWYVTEGPGKALGLVR